MKENLPVRNKGLDKRDLPSQTESNNFRYQDRMTEKDTFESPELFDGMSSKTRVYNVRNMGNQQNVSRKLSTTVRPMMRQEFKDKAYHVQDKMIQRGIPSLSRKSTFTKDKSDIIGRHSLVQHHNEKLVDETDGRLGIISVQTERQDNGKTKGALKYRPRIHNRSKGPSKIYKKVSDAIRIGKTGLNTRIGGENKQLHLSDASRIRYECADEQVFKRYEHLNCFHDNYVNNSESTNQRRSGVHNQEPHLRYANSRSDVDAVKHNSVSEYTTRKQMNQNMENLSAMDVVNTDYRTTSSMRIPLQKKITVGEAVLEIVIQPDKEENILYRKTRDQEDGGTGSTHVFVESGRVAAYLHPKVPKYGHVNGASSGRSQVGMFIAIKNYLALHGYGYIHVVLTRS